MGAARAARGAGRRGARAGGGGGGGGGQGAAGRFAEARGRPSPARGGAAAAPGDADLGEVLSLASDAELFELSVALDAASPLSPWMKAPGSRLENALTRAAPRAASPREARERALEDRILFLAAGGADCLRGRRPSYREALEGLRRTLRGSGGAASAQESGDLLISELEMEIFCLLVEAFHADAAEDAAALGDGMAASARELRGATLPLRLGWRALITTVLTGAAALAATPAALGSEPSRSIAFEVLVREVGAGGAGRELLVGSMRGGVGAGGLRGLAGVAGGGALRAATPVLWAVFAADLLLKSCGTDHARLARAVFALAQVRLLRTGGFSAPPPPDPPVHPRLPRTSRPPIG